MPSFEQFENPEIEHASILYASDESTVLGKYYRRNRTIAQYEDLSEPLKNTLLATEDLRFFAHPGIDLRSLLRAIMGKLTFRYAGGGSTITMQLAENLYRTSTENKGKWYKNKEIGRFITKCKEWVIAIELEKNFTKEEIMAMYLNTIPFGSNAYGINEATKTFFGIHPSEVAYPEAALLIALINAPTRYSPILNPTRSEEKRKEILYNLYKHGKVSRTHYDSLNSMDFSINYTIESHDRGLATYFRSVVRGFLMRWASRRGYDLFGEGLRIYTTLDVDMQRHAEAAVRDEMRRLQRAFDEHWGADNPWIDEEGNEIEAYLEGARLRTTHYRSLVARYGDDQGRVEEAWHAKRPMRVFGWEGARDTLFSFMDSLAYYKRFLHAGLMAMHPESGKVRAWVGGINYKYFKFDHVQQGKRQPGSTIKPFVYTAVIDNGYTPCYEVIDQPVTFYLPNQYPPTWTPSNATGPPSGRKMTIRQAMARSVNSITAYWMKRMGMVNVVDYAHRLGIKSPIAAVPSLCLGSGGDVSVYEMTGAFCTFVHRGIWTEPLFIQRIEDKNGNVLQEFVPEQTESIREETAYIMLHMLKGTVEEAGGTARRVDAHIRARGDIGAKTGTTQNASDGWFFGLTPELVTGIWVGGEDRSIHFKDWSMGQGARTALPIWNNFMRRLYADSSLHLYGGYFKPPRRPLSVQLDCSQHFIPLQRDTLPAEPERQGIQIEDIF